METFDREHEPNRRTTFAGAEERQLHTEWNYSPVSLLERVTDVRSVALAEELYTY